MNKRFLVGFVLLLVAVLLLGFTYRANAGSTWTAVSTYEYDCFTGFTADGGIWENEQGLTHIRGILHSNVNVSDTPELNGLHHTVANAEINGLTGNAIIRGTTSWQPYGIEGTWEGHWVVVYNKNRASGQAVMRGTGALQGKMVYLDVYDAPPDGQLEAMCAGIGEPEGYVRTEGYMMEVP
jgi:hypothetical protein